MDITLKNSLIFTTTNLAMEFYRLMGIKVSIEHTHRIPNAGGAIIVANHRSMIDGPLIYSIMNRMIYSLIKEDYFKNRFMNWYLRGGGGIPISSGRSHQFSAREAYRHLRRGQMLLVFPEGRINYDHGVLAFNEGFVKLAMTALVPIIPITIFGTERALPQAQWKWIPKSAHVHIAVGDPIHLSNYHDERQIGAIAEQTRHIILNTWLQLSHSAGLNSCLEGKPTELPIRGMAGISKAIHKATSGGAL